MRTAFNPGDAVTFLDVWRNQRKAGVFVGARRSATNPWIVAVVRLQNGSEEEVHRDRLEAAPEEERR